MNANGLTGAQVEERIRKGQINKTVFEHQKTFSEIVSSHVFTLFNGINLLLAILVLLTGQVKNMLFMGTVLINTVIGIVQEERARRSLAKLREEVLPKSTVIRDGKQTVIESEGIVLDDLLVIKAGDKMPCDGILQSGQLRVNESLLTGESDLIDKKEGDPILAGTIIMQGSARVTATAVGNDSYSAKIMAEVQKEKRLYSRLRDALDFIIKHITIILVPLGILLFLRQHYLSGLPIRSSLLGTVAALVGMIPEGLILLTSVALNIGSILLSRESTLVKEMYSLETLARTDVFAADKTGTITTGRMNLEKIENCSEKDVENILANLVRGGEDRNPTSTALEEALPVKEKLNCIRYEAFSSATKKTLFETDDHLYELGAYEFLEHHDDGHVKKDIENYMKDGLRVLCLLEDHEIIALVILKDEIRKNAEETIAYILDQGVSLKVISGDHPDTVAALLRQIRYPYADNAVDCSKLSDEQLKEAAESASIFGRCTPKQKGIILSTLQANGHTVGMMGDGINDILAIRQADFSIALASGVESVREVANVVLVDDDFAHIPSIIKQGRRVINNIKRTATLFLTKTAMSILLSVLVILFLKDYPYEPIQLTLLSSLCIGMPSFVLSFEPKYDRVEKSFLSDIFNKAISSGLSIVLSICILKILQSLGHMDVPQFETMAFFTAAGTMIYLIFTISRPLTLLRTAILILSAAGILIGYLFFRDFFSFALLQGKTILITLAITVFSIFLQNTMERYGTIRKITEKIDDMY
ncbi:MAG: HAD-IC family P-type ATPase [Erysipelotrichaceae bacterium]|nr:HAD-IC family P-type ATPase [Erysipelotrichaceae bacterium]